MLPRIRSNSFFYLHVLYYARSINEWHVQILPFGDPDFFGVPSCCSALFCCFSAMLLLYCSSFCYCRRPYTAVESLLLKTFLTFLLSLLLLAFLLLIAYLLLLAYPAVAGLTTIVNTPFVNGFSTNSGVPAVRWHPLMFQLSLVLLPVLQLLFFLVLLFHPWVSCGESLCCGCRLYCCRRILCY